MRGKVPVTLVLERAIPTSSRSARRSRSAASATRYSFASWTKIVDGNRAIERVQVWREPSAIIEAAVRQYRRNNWQDQPAIGDVWSEKSIVQGVLAPALDELGVTFRIMKGFGSSTAVRQAAEDSDVLASDQKQTVAWHTGDWDPSRLSCASIAWLAMPTDNGSQRSSVRWPLLRKRHWEGER